MSTRRTRASVENTQVGLAKQSKKPDTTEKGADNAATGGVVQAYTTGSALGYKRPSIKQLTNMVDNDGTAQGIYNAMAFPVIASDYHIEPHPDDNEVIGKDENGDDIIIHPQADLAEQSLRRGTHEGGMSTPMSSVISNMCFALVQAYRTFEIVWQINKDGFFTFKKIVAREPETYDFIYDENGGFAGITQRIYKNNKYDIVTILPEYLFLFTNRKERNNVRGMSAFNSMYQDYEKKQKLYYLASQQAQINGVPLKIAKAMGATNQTDRDNMTKVIDNLVGRAAVTLPAGWELEVDHPTGSYDLLPLIEHMNTEMAISVLAQGIFLGSRNGSQGGSYSLADSHKDLFMMGIKAFITSIEEHVDSYLISKLIDFNFEKPLYPKFKINDPSDSVSSLVDKAFTDLTTKGAVSTWVAEAINKKMAEKLDLDEPEDADNTFVGTGSVSNTSTKTEAVPTTVENSAKKKAVKLAKNSYWRDLTSPESKVQFGKIEKQAIKAEVNFVAAMKQPFIELQKNAIASIKPILKDADVTALDNLDLGGTATLQKVMYGEMLNTYSEAKKMAADEIGVNAPANKQTSKDLMSQYTQSVADKQISDLSFAIKKIVTDAIRTNNLAKTELAIDDVISSIASIFDIFFSDKIEITGSALITTALNVGRDDVFMQFDNKIYGYQYSAILDEKVCKVCEDLDGCVADSDEYHDTKWMPPIHFHCRCIWVAIMEDEEDKPAITGIPSTPGGTTSPTLAHEHLEGVYLSKSLEHLWRSMRI